jgi:xanthine/CO dehydrogenase XdhC/CoxF family maturation factor
MGTRTIVVCDGCGQEDLASHAEVWIRTGRTMDPSGDGYNDDGETVYLCTACCQRIIKRLIRDATDQDNALLLVDIKRRKERLAKVTT